MYVFHLFVHHLFCLCECMIYLLLVCSCLFIPFSLFIGLSECVACLSFFLFFLLLFPCFVIPFFLSACLALPLFMYLVISAYIHVSLFVSFFC